MTGKIKNSLSAKVFCLLFAVLLLVSVGICFAIAGFAPEIYENELTSVLEDGAKELTKELENCGTMKKAERLLGYFERAYQAEAALLNADGDTIYPSYDRHITVTDKSSQGEIVISFHTNLSALKPYDVNIGGDKYTLLVMGNMMAVNQAAKVLRRIVPYILAVTFVVSFFTAVFCTQYITGPVKRLSRISKRMAKLDFKERYRMARTDEIGILGENLNILSENLSHTLYELKQVNEELKDDIEKKEEAEKSRIAFFSAVSHELKTPITILKGHLGGMLEGVGGYKNRDYYLQRSLYVAEDMEEMVRELLTISRIETREAAEDRENLDLAEQVRIQLAEMTELMEERRQYLEADLPSHCYVRAQPAAMTHVFRNLISNAVRYTPNAGIIRVYMKEGENDIFCRVENTGIHIPEKMLPHIFEAFYRVESSRNRKSGGSGLGLYIVKTALEEQGASFGAENTAGGVRFWFCLPKSP